MKNRWTYDDFKDRVKYKIGDKVFVIEMSRASNINPPMLIEIKTKVIKGLSRGTLNVSDPSTATILYTVEDDNYDFVFEENSSTSYYEAIDMLEKEINKTRDYYIEEYKKLFQNLDDKYDYWKKELEIAKKLLTIEQV